MKNKSTLYLIIIGICILILLGVAICLAYL